MNELQELRDAVEDIDTYYQWYQEAVEESNEDRQGKWLGYIGDRAEFYWPLLKKYLDRVLETE